MSYYSRRLIAWAFLLIIFIVTYIRKSLYLQIDIAIDAPQYEKDIISFPEGNKILTSKLKTY